MQFKGLNTHTVLFSLLATLYFQSVDSLRPHSSKSDSQLASQRLLNASLHVLYKLEFS